MRQVLFRIPAPWGSVPIFGYGVMLFIAFVVCTMLAARLAARSRADREAVVDLAYWLIGSGLVGGRLFYFVQYHNQFAHWYEFFFIWQGGLVIYGAAAGGLVGFLLFTRLRRLPRLWLLDVIAPSLALGMAIGRIGCLLNGCCYGDVCALPWSVRFPHGSPASMRLVDRGYQSRLGFVAVPDDRRVLFVEPGSDAEREGLRPGDRIVAVEGRSISGGRQLTEALLKAGNDAPLAALHRNPFLSLRDDRPVEITVEREGEAHTLAIERPWTLPLHPTQIYSSISGFLLFLVLYAYYPLRRRDGEVIAWFAMLYAVGRFLVEFLRFDEAPFLFGMTISQNISVLMFAAGLATLLIVHRRPAQYGVANG